MKYLFSKIERRAMRLMCLGIMIGVLICMVILMFYPIVETTQACTNCGHEAWYFKIAEK